MCDNIQISADVNPERLSIINYCMLCLQSTCACWGVWLPEEATIDLCARDSGGPLQDVAGITLEHHMVPGLLAVAAAGTVSGHARVVAGGRRGDWKSKQGLDHWNNMKKANVIA